MADAKLIYIVLWAEEGMKAGTCMVKEFETNAGATDFLNRILRRESVFKAQVKIFTGYEIVWEIKKDDTNAKGTDETVVQ